MGGGYQRGMSLSPLAFESMGNQERLGHRVTSLEGEGGGLCRWQPALDTMSSIKTKWMDVVLESLLHSLLGYILGLLSTLRSEETQSICSNLCGGFPQPPAISPFKHKSFFFSFFLRTVVETNFCGYLGFLE